jgi:type I restriction enzyme M protein
MAKPKKTDGKAPDKKGAKTSANLGFEGRMWAAADTLRGSMDASEYKHVVLGLIFLKYISDSFEELHIALKEGKGEHKGADAEDKDEYLAKGVFWVPEAARWSVIQAQAKQPSIGKHPGEG